MDARAGLMLIFSLVGIVSLLFLAQVIEPKLTTIAQATMVNSSFFQSNPEIRILANITSINQVKNSTTFFQLRDSSGTLPGIIFEANSVLLNLNKSKTYEITGRLSEYENETEIIISKINSVVSIKKKK